MNWFNNFIRKYLLVKEIVSKEGVVHFRRYRLLSTPLLNIYVHNILASDEDDDPHDHPWGFVSFILKGAYLEEWQAAHLEWMYRIKRELVKDERTFGSLIIHEAKDFHKITLRTPSVWTLVFASGHDRPNWGYQTKIGWVNFKEYRELKREGKLR